METGLSSPGILSDPGATARPAAHTRIVSLRSGHPRAAIARRYRSH